MSKKTCFMLRVVQAIAEHTASGHKNKFSTYLGYFRLQEARLDVLKKLLKQREEHHQELNTKRLDRLWYVYNSYIQFQVTYPFTQ